MTRRRTISAADSRAVLQANASEKDLQAHLEDLLSRCGWRFHHETDSRLSAAGWPDLPAIRIQRRFLPDGRPNYPWVLLLEVKRHGGKLSKEQRDLWVELQTFHIDSTEVGCAVVYPANLAGIEAWITNGWPEYAPREDQR